LLETVATNKETYISVLALLGVIWQFLYSGYGSLVVPNFFVAFYDIIGHATWNSCKIYDGAHGNDSTIAYPNPTGDCREAQSNFVVK
jgi:hypothetical protein